VISLTPRRHEIFLWLLQSVSHAFEAMFQKDKERSVHNLLSDLVFIHLFFYLCAVASSREAQIFSRHAAT
jgi:phosphate starvation-inducible membrane PsiE